MSTSYCDASDSTGIDPTRRWRLDVFVVEGDNDYRRAFNCDSALEALYATLYFSGREYGVVDVARPPQQRGGRALGGLLVTTLCLSRWQALRPQGGGSREHGFLSPHLRGSWHGLTDTLQQHGISRRLC